MSTNLLIDKKVNILAEDCADDIFDILSECEDLDDVINYRIEIEEKIKDAIENGMELMQ